MSTEKPIDLFHYYHISLNPDGTLTRNLERYTTVPAKPDPSDPDPVLSKDVTINPATGTWARLYLPKRAPPTEKLPLLVYFRCGGFILLNADSTGVHAYCSSLAAELPAAVLSVDYRLAPEHRLPAAYDDAVDALRWVKDAAATGDAWFSERVDFDRCFLMGNSAGANIAYHAGQRVAGSVNEFFPVKINGLILQEPFFGGTQGMESELKNTSDRVLPPGSCELMWELSLPVGADRDHEYCNPRVGNKGLEEIRNSGWRVLVSGCEGDPLYDRQVAVAKLMEEKGIKVEARFAQGGYHGIELMDPSQAKLGFLSLKQFIASV